MKTNELIQELRSWADKMALPGRRTLVTEAADRMEELEERVYRMEERIAIMEEGNTSSVGLRPTPSPQGEGNITIAPEANVDLTAILDSIDKATSGLIEEE